ncbi:UDP-N-acetylmuramoyl-L-alanyl-D-glutamate--2,6-diaminopimelate ligase [Frankia sp. Cppng1_Ct_nod]|uniref:UDP-N-acetylmuramoyl-L-alanyl-D-glutamate--2, 6-diaminopimelate ligase n=1 Tax=Frankia sp. Cppng1_Ct_nod TaxID=2897162 RepID=UPI0010413AC9|nr:UDP-N-acetylmuramoyl-L-alanyl-D-glutamate--2,6-diaminopimelate ligase [Frankia sp. Cppng1_Ct_nod]
MTSSGLRPAIPAARALTDLAARYPDLDVVGAGYEGVVVHGVTHDSRAVRPGDLYAALPGAHVHGAAFAGQALASGAAAVLTDRAGAERVIRETATGGTVTRETTVPAAVPLLVAVDPRAVLGAVASWVYGDPSASLRLLGVTGTNGKTTVAYLLEAGLRAAGHSTGLVGTVQTRIAGTAVPSVRTTPEATDLQALLAVMVERGVTAAAMEVSSHAVALHRVGGIHFAGAAFTNLSQDHLDFHLSMDDYFEAKAALFTPRRTGVSVVDTDTGWGRRLAGRIPGAVTCGVNPDARWRAVDVATDPTGTTFRALGPQGTDVQVRIALPGTFNVSNALVALALLAETGVPAETAVRGFASLPGVPGRMERVDAGQPFLGLVDYAHTPDAVETLLRTVRPLVTGRVIVVLGCGGDRDRGKRPLMGAAAARGADLSIFTSDNPRSEDPDAIIAQMCAGAARVPAGLRGGVVVEPDRATAIGLAVRQAGPADAVVVAGKGHETGQVRDGTVTPFDDRDALRTELAGCRPASRPSQV